MSLEKVHSKLSNDIKYDFTASMIATLVIFLRGFIDFFQCEPII